jgi:hypothetical protein
MEEYYKVVTFVKGSDGGLSKYLVVFSCPFLQTSECYYISASLGSDSQTCIWWLLVHRHSVLEHD